MFRSFFLPPETFLPWGKRFQHKNAAQHAEAFTSNLQKLIANRLIGLRAKTKKLRLTVGVDMMTEPIELETADALSISHISVVNSALPHASNCL